MDTNALHNHAAHVVSLASEGTPADAALRRYLDGSRRLGPAASREVSRAVFAVFRWWGWLDPKGSPQARVAMAADLQRRFATDPTCIKPEALAARAVPQWLGSELELSADYLLQIQRDPTLWIRPRLAFKGPVARSPGGCTPAAVPASLAPVGPFADLCALSYAGPTDLFQTPAFEEGQFEIQDIASQWVGLACRPAPGQSWWDACAGEGGKTLHLCDLLRGKGLVWATDRSERRIAVLRKRARRAQAFNYEAGLWDGAGKPPFGRNFDGVLIDAPCSGVGTWQRNPHARWTTRLEDVKELAVVQASLLDAASARVKPGGRLVYAVCTLTRSETTAVAEAFTQRHPEFTGSPVFVSGPSQWTIWPHQVDGNGMFLASWTRAKS